MKRVVAFFFVLLFTLGATVGAQVLTGNIIGTVKDESGAVLPGVTVTIGSPALRGGPMTTVTNDKGEYRFRQLDPGSYSLTITLSGFNSFQQANLEVSVSSTIERDVVLKVGAIAETVTVTGGTPIV